MTSVLNDSKLKVKNRVKQERISPQSLYGNPELVYVKFHTHARQRQNEDGGSWISLRTLLGSLISNSTGTVEQTRRDQACPGNMYPKQTHTENWIDGCKKEGLGRQE